MLTSFQGSAELPDHQFHVSAVRSGRGDSMVQVTGPLTTDAAAHLADVLDLLINVEQSRITVDLSRAHVAHPAVVTVLRLAMHHQQTAGRRLSITGATPALSRALGLAAERPATGPSSGLAVRCETGTG